ncbi:hypothetical protein AVEN_154273-1 [Araneus ventricosus]|uniref:Uncharacterized protein n=1 Tax=Araneus ventricosus TaxID=182803 RepID=A0A4Y2N6F0_ARAVE|nr:hypothetical protein AVEN_154273-1 [Araneus ventricosus]
MVVKTVLQGEAWSDLSDSYGTHDLGNKLGDHFGDLRQIWRPWRQIDDSRKCNPFLDISIRGPRSRFFLKILCDVTAYRGEYIRPRLDHGVSLIDWLLHFEA